MKALFCFVGIPGWVCFAIDAWRANGGGRDFDSLDFAMAAIAGAFLAVFLLIEGTKALRS